MLTAEDSPDMENQLLDAGAAEFLSKRESPSIMVSRIRKVLEFVR
jgi:DNA-binding NarL/FixJ family response regulator